MNNTSRTSNTYLAQIAPQRSTQYASLASTLAPSELLLSPIRAVIESISPCQLGGQSYLHLALTEPLDQASVDMLGSLAMTTAFFKLHEQIGGVAGPFLEPFETSFAASQPTELITTRRYRGKTNELFTHWLCNIAKFSSDFATVPWSELTLMDPLAGGGTTLFTGLVLGASVTAGVEQDPKNGKSTATFLKQFADENHIPVRLKEERLKKLGRRWTVSLGKPPENYESSSDNIVDRRDLGQGNTSSQNRERKRNSADHQSFVWTQGDAAQVQALLPGLKPHLIVADLPYGIQHQGLLIELIHNALPSWTNILRHGGIIALAWDATRFSESKMHSLLAEVTDLDLLCDPPYNTLAHRVDRVIKRRNVALLRG